MKLSDFITEDSIVEELKATDKDSVIRELVGTLRKAGRILEEDVPVIIKALIRREELGSTGIGRGIAVPHTKHERVKSLIGAFGRSSNGIEFNALDEGLVRWVFLLLSPPENPREHLAALEHISRLLRSKTFCDRLDAAVTKEDLIGIIRNSADYIEV